MQSTVVAASSDKEPIIGKPNSFYLLESDHGREYLDQVFGFAEQPRLFTSYLSLQTQNSHSNSSLEIYSPTTPKYDSDTAIEFEHFDIDIALDSLKNKNIVNDFNQLNVLQQQIESTESSNKDNAITSSKPSLLRGNSNSNNTGNIDITPIDFNSNYERLYNNLHSNNILLLKNDNKNRSTLPVAISSVSSTRTSPDLSQISTQISPKFIDNETALDINESRLWQLAATKKKTIRSRGPSLVSQSLSDCTTRGISKPYMINK
eukprot:Awhi_evm1s4517